MATTESADWFRREDASSDDAFVDPFVDPSSSPSGLVSSCLSKLFGTEMMKALEMKTVTMSARKVRKWLSGKDLFASQDQLNSRPQTTGDKMREKKPHDAATPFIVPRSFFMQQLLVMIDRHMKQRPADIRLSDQTGNRYPRTAVVELK